MHYQIELTDSKPIKTAVIRSRVPAKDLAQFVPPRAARCARSFELPDSRDQDAIWLCISMTDPSKSGPKYRNRSPATSGFIVRSYPQAVW
jgi:hypothetical protein